MRKKLMLVGAIFLWQSFFMNAGGLYGLYHLFTAREGVEAWLRAYNATKREVGTIVNSTSYEFDNGDLMIFSSFLCNRNYLIDFIEAPYFDRDKHIPWLINLFQITYKLTCYFSDDRQFLNRYEIIVNSLDNENFVTTIKSKNFENLSKNAERILCAHTDWGG